jgi:hypothetical protein
MRPPLAYIGSVSLSIAIVASLGMPFFALATSGACSYHGGVDCAAGPGIYGQAICNDGWTGSSVSYDSMVECGGGYYSQPSCPLFSSYDSLSGSCKCNYGYVVSGNQCISEDQSCENQLGYNSHYNVLNNTCECTYGDIIVGGTCANGNLYCWSQLGSNSSYDTISKQCECDSGYQISPTSGQCVSQSTYCTDQFGNNAQYNYLTSGCSCKSGYVLNASKDGCINGDTYCQITYGYNSSFDSLSKTCQCDAGYQMENGTCQEIPTVSNPYSAIIYQNVPTPVTPVTSNTASATTYNITSNLKLGSSGTDIVTLQTFLENKGFLILPAGTINGHFGLLTQQALINFQLANGLPPTGYCGAMTRQLINGE